MTDRDAEPAAEVDDRILRWLVGGAVLFWSGVAAFTWLQHLLVGGLAGGSPVAGRTLLYSTVASLTWVPFTLAVLWLAWTVPFRREAWRRPLAIHAAGALATAFGVNAVMITLFHLLGLPLPGEGPLVEIALTEGLRWLHVIVLVYAALVGAAHGVRHLAAARERERRLLRLRARLSEARLAALRARLEPHFLFNTLHTMGLLWRLDRGREAQEMLEEVSVLLRRMLDDDGRQTLPLSEDLELARAYLRVEGVRFGDRLSVEVDVPDELGDVHVPALLLQPLVENAVLHGVEGGRGAGEVVIRASRDDTGLRIDVLDDGPGPADPIRAGVPDGSTDSSRGRSGSGTALGALRERCRHLYGDGARVELCEREESGGSRVTVWIPAGAGLRAADE